MSSYPPSGKFKRVSSGELVLPAHCASCGAIDVVEGFVDFGLSFEFFGVLYLCHNCVFEATQVFDNNPYDNLKQQLINAQEENARLEAINHKLEIAVDNFALTRISDRNLASDSRSSDGSSVVAAAGTGGSSAGRTLATAGVKGTSNSGTAKSVTSKRSHDASNPQPSNDTLLDI